MTSETRKQLYREQLDTCIPIMWECGKIAKKYYNKESQQVQYKKENLEEPVTQADLEINTLLLKYIKQSNGNHIILSEESFSDDIIPTITNLQDNNTLIWIIDPIDGTYEFIHNVPNFCISIGVFNKKGTVMSFLYNPIANFFSYSFDKNVFLYNFDTKVFDTVPITPPKKEKSDKIKIVISRSEHKKGLFDDLIAISDKIDLCTIGSIAYKLGLVAVHQADIVISRRPKHIWDIAGGYIQAYRQNIPCFETENNVLQWNTQQLKYEGIIVGHTEHFNKLNKILNSENK